MLAPSPQATPADFVKKWTVRFADNNFQYIREATFREFAADVAAVFGVSPPFVPEYLAGITYQKDFLVRYTPAGGQEAFYYALVAGSLAAPGPGNTTEWKVVPGPVSATSLWQSITQVQAQNSQGVKVQAGRKYQVDFGPDANGDTQYVYLEGLDQYFDTTRGVLEISGVLTAIEQIDIVAGTWQVAGTGTPVPAQAQSIQRYGYSNGRYDTFTPDATGLQASVSGPLGGATIRLNVRQLYLYDKLAFASTNGDATCKIFCFGAIISPGPPGTRFLNPWPGTILLDTATFFCPDYGFLFDGDGGSQANGRASAFHLYRNEFIKSAALNATTPIAVLNRATLIVEDTVVGPEFRFSVDASSKIILRGTTNGTIGAGATDIWPVGTIDERVSAAGLVDLLKFTDAQMDEVIALGYTDCDADPADSPAWSLPRMEFDAIDPSDGVNYHYYCTYPTYVPGSGAARVKPAWHRVEKLGNNAAPSPQLAATVDAQRATTLSGLATGAAMTDYEYQFRPGPAVSAQRVVDITQTLAAGESAADYEYQTR